MVVIVTRGGQLAQCRLRAGRGARIDAEQGGVEVVGWEPASGNLTGGGGLQVVTELRGGLESLELVLGERVQHHGIQCGGHSGVQRARRDRWLADVLVGDGGGTVAPEWRAAGEHLEEHHTGGVEVGAGIDGFTACLFRREVLGRSQHRARVGDRCRIVGHGPGDAEVHDLDLAVLGDHDVAGLDVTVHEQGTMAVFESGQDPGDDSHRLAWLERAVGDDVTQEPPVNVFHDDVGNLCLDAVRFTNGLLAGIEDAHNSGVRHPRRFLRLFTEQDAEARVGGEGRLQELDRNAPSEAGVGADVDIRHATAPDEITELVSASKQAGTFSHVLSPGGVGGLPAKCNA